jgi:biopolymer transport protein TolR
MGPMDFGGGDEGYRPMSEINVTPFVDVMLVLLIIFMIAAPLMSVSVPIQLPKTQAAKFTPPREPVIVSIDKDGKLYIKNDPVPSEELVPRLAKMAAEQRDQTVFVRGDRDIDYGKVMDLLGRVGQAGFAKVSLMAELPSGTAAAR